MSKILAAPRPFPPLLEPTLADIAAHLAHEALQGANVGADDDFEYLKRCTYDIALPGPSGKGVRFMYARSLDEGFFFVHLSMSFRLYARNKPLRFDHRFARGAVPYFFQPDLADTLVYPSSTAEGKRWNVWHFRLFTDDAWKADPDRAPRDGQDGARFTWPQYLEARFP